MIKEKITFTKAEFKEILNDFLTDKGFKNVTGIKVTIGGNSHDFITGCGYLGVGLEVETTREESI